MADLTLKLYLKDLEGRQRYIYNCSCDPDKFKNQKAEEIVARYSGQIRQDDLDDIVDRELKFLSWRMKTAGALQWYLCSAGKGSFSLAPTSSSVLRQRAGSPTSLMGRSKGDLLCGYRRFRNFTVGTF